MHKQVIWIGIRESDIAYTGKLFDASITILGSGKGVNHSMEVEVGSRINHNGGCEEYETFLGKSTQEALEKYPNAFFVQYDALDGVNLPPHIKSRLIYQNNESLLEWLDRKVEIKEYASSLIDCLPYKVINLSDCTDKRLREFFPYANELVIQENESYGGCGTWHVTLDSIGFLKFRNKSDHAIVSEYIEKNIPVNVHCVIYEKDVILFSPSIQLINQCPGSMDYIGADFSAFQTLAFTQKEMVNKNARIICSDLQKHGYRGVCGIDFILAGERCYFMEVNGRFQASTAFLNRRLMERGYPCQLFFRT